MVNLVLPTVSKVIVRPQRRLLYRLENRTGRRPPHPIYQTLELLKKLIKIFNYNLKFLEVQ